MNAKMIIGICLVVFNVAGVIILRVKNKKKLYVRVKAVGAKKWSKVVKIKVKK